MFHVIGFYLSAVMKLLFPKSDFIQLNLRSIPAIETVVSDMLISMAVLFGSAQHVFPVLLESFSSPSLSKHPRVTSVRSLWPPSLLLQSISRGDDF